MMKGSRISSPGDRRTYGDLAQENTTFCNFLVFAGSTSIWSCFILFLFKIFNYKGGLCINFFLPFVLKAKLIYEFLRDPPSK